MDPSSLDQKSEKTVLDLVQTEFAGWTTLVVAHRLRTIVDFDRVVVLQGGRIVESGPPRKLLGENSLFKELWELQQS